MPPRDNVGTSTFSIAIESLTRSEAMNWLTVKLWSASTVEGRSSFTRRVCYEIVWFWRYIWRWRWYEMGEHALSYIQEKSLLLCPAKGSEIQLDYFGRVLRGVNIRNSITLLRASQLNSGSLITPRKYFWVSYTIKHHTSAKREDMRQSTCQIWLWQNEEGTHLNMCWNTSPTEDQTLSNHAWPHIVWALYQLALGIHLA